MDGRAGMGRSTGWLTGIKISVTSGFYKGLSGIVIGVDDEDVILKLNEESEMLVYVERSACRLVDQT